MSTSASTPTARLTAKGSRRWLAGHPWIYRSDVAQRPEVDNGALVPVTSHRGRRLGWAAWSTESLITLRRVPLGRDEDPESGWMRLLDGALDRRAGRPPCTRLVNADADGLPGLIVDRFGPGLSLQTLTPAAERRRSAVVQQLVERFAPGVVALRNDTRTRVLEGLPHEKRLLVGDDPRVEAPVGPLRWAFDLLEGQKTGGFLDQIENHQAAARFAVGECLDCFTYEGGFALQMAAAGRPVTAVDSSAPALARLQAHAARNDLSVEIVEANVFDLLRGYEREGRRFDTIVLDPPPFCRSRKAVAAGRRAYKEINLRALKLLRPGGRLVTASCSAHLTRTALEQVVAEAAADARVWAQIIERRGPPPDHPSLATAPETDYLKALFVQVAG